MRSCRYLVLLALLAVSQIASAQFVIGRPGAAASAASAPSPNWMSAAGRVFVDTTKLVGRRVGSSQIQFGVSCDANTDPTCDSTSSSYNPQSRLPEYTFIDNTKTGGGGSFRISCKFSHMGFDDPIVYSGDPGRSHLHYFFGNTSTSSASDLTDMSLTGTSTCAGGKANATGYWIPGVIYDCPKSSTDPCDHSRHGEPQIPDAMNAYYKCPSSGVVSNTGASAYYCSSGGYGGTPARFHPVGFRMITGDPASTHPIAAGDGGIVCYQGGTSVASFDHIPTTAEATAVGGCDSLNLFPQFPECWDGVNIDSPDHKSHVARANYYQGCPADHPVLLPWIGLNIHVHVNTADLDYLRLSSDPPKSSGQPGGWTLHADWVNGWSHQQNFGGLGKGTVTDMLMCGCYNVCYGVGGTPFRAGDCHDDNVGSPLNDKRFWQLL